MMARIATAGNKNPGSVATNAAGADCQSTSITRVSGVLDH
jgi:hypothetical protein